jgi:GPH family glycoside/pentoside/hexuronide:cation symporter
MTLARREVWSYAAGDFGFNTVWQSIELYLLFYYVRQLGIPPTTASAIFLAGAAADLLMDMLVGVVADRLAPRVSLGTWVAIGGPVSVLILCAVFAPPPVPAGYVTHYALLTYLALRCAYGIGNIPYGALTARISADPGDHLRLTGARMQAAAAGGLLAAAVYALFPADGRGAFETGAIILAIVAVPAFLATTSGSHERVAPVVATRLPGAALALLGRSPALRRLLVTILAVGLAVSLINVSLLFVFDRIGARRWGYIAALIPSLSLLLTTPAWTRAAARFGPVAVLRAAAAMLLAAALIGLIGGTNVACAMAGMTGAIVAGQGLSVMFWTLVPATVAACERDAGATGFAAQVYAMATIARKFAQAIATLTLGYLLATPWLPVLGGIALAGCATLICALFYAPMRQDARWSP